MQWLVFSRLEPAAAKALLQALDARLAEHLAHAGGETSWNASVMARGPKGAKRPEGTQSLFKIDVDPEEDPIAASMLRMLLQKGEPIEVDWGTRSPPEEVLEMLEELEAEPGLSSDEGDGEPDLEEEALFERVLEAVHAASEDMERSVELREAVQEASPQARAWMEHVVRHNVRTDAEVDRALGLQPPISERVHREIEALLEEMAE